MRCLQGGDLVGEHGGRRGRDLAAPAAASVARAVAVAVVAFTAALVQERLDVRSMPIGQGFVDVFTAARSDTEDRGGEPRSNRGGGLIEDAVGDQDGDAATRAVDPCAGLRGW